MKHNIWCTAALLLSFTWTSCNDWLNLLPNNEQVTEDYWKSKEDVEHVVASGYYYMRSSVPSLVNWGELRGGDFYNALSGSDASKLQEFDLLADNETIDYSSLYKVISMANSVLMYAPEVLSLDKTYHQAMMQSHLSEAYFQRAWAYSILVKNYKEVPLIIEAYVNDDAEMKLPKASESQIIAQIKEDVKCALATGSAKINYEVEWQTKGRATKWALYALMVDICLWNHEYDECIKYADMILKPTDILHPAFLKESGNWFSIFNPGLSNESIFELYWDYNTEALNNNFTYKFSEKGFVSGSKSGVCNFTRYALRRLEEETGAVLAAHPELSINDRVGRMLNASYSAVSSNYSGGIFTSTGSGLWKYVGAEGNDIINKRVHEDANFILYRVADVMLMKAEALVMKGETSWKEAIELINEIRERACLKPYVDLELSTADDDVKALDQLNLLTEVMNQREMEFLGEAHRWYDILRLARYDAKFAPIGTVEESENIAYERYNTSGFGDDVFRYKEVAIGYITSGNQTNSKSQLESILSNSWAWYLPLPKSDLDSNKRLKQNPYYK